MNIIVKRNGLIKIENVLIHDVWLAFGKICENCNEFE